MFHKQEGLKFHSENIYFYKVANKQTYRFMQVTQNENKTISFSQ